MLPMKPTRKALARPGRIKGSETVANVAPWIGAQRLRGLRERGTHALDYADQYK